MNVRELKRLLPEFQSKSFQGISCLKIQSYAQIYLSIHNMVFVNSLDDEYGRREIYRRKLETLVDILLRRCRRDGITEEEQVRILDTVFYVLYNSSVTIDRETEDYCWERASDLIEHYRPRLEDEKAESSDVYLVMRLIFYDLYGVEAADGEACSDTLQTVLRHLEHWVAGLDAEGHWEGLSEKDALWRISLLCMNSYMQGDDRFDEPTRRAFDYYCVRPLASMGEAEERRLSDEELRRWGHRYAVMQQSGICDPKIPLYMDSIAGFLERQQEHLPDTSFEYMFCSGIAIDSLCRRLTEEVQNSLFK